MKTKQTLRIVMSGFATFSFGISLITLVIAVAGFSGEISLISLGVTLFIWVVLLPLLVVVEEGLKKTLKEEEEAGYEQIVRNEIVLNNKQRKYRDQRDKLQIHLAACLSGLTVLDKLLYLMEDGYTKRDIQAALEDCYHSLLMTDNSTNKEVMELIDKIQKRLHETMSLPAQIQAGVLLDYEEEE
jgi:hypothetical protein